MFDHIIKPWFAMLALTTTFTCVACLASEHTSSDTKALGTFRTTNLIVDDQTTLNGKVTQIVDFTESNPQHAALQSISAGIGISGFDGGIQSFQQSTYNTTTGTQQSISVYAGNTASISAGGNDLTNYGVFASAANGTNNYSFFGNLGLLQNNEGALLLTSTNGVTVGSGTVAAAANMQVNVPFTMSNTQRVDLGNNVASFKIAPVPATGGTFLDVGYASAPLAQIATKNTDTGGSFGGLEVHLDTTVSATARGGVQLYRGAGGADEVGGLNIAAGGDFAAGSVANDVVLHSYDPTSAGRRVVIGTGSTPSVRAAWTTGGDYQMPVSGQTGHLTDIGTAPTLTGCGAGPAPTVSTGAWSFTVTTGGGATGCVLTFSKAFATAPTCVVTAQNSIPVVYVVTGVSIALGANTAAGATYDINCIGHD